jgi:predicted O-methyltransferase YrrM
MFHDIPEEIQERMEFLESLDARERQKGKPAFQRLRQIPRETGRFLAILAASAPSGTWLEIGTSGGYSALWLSLACRELGQKLVTFEILEEKVNLARETFRSAGIEDYVRLVHGDARKFLNDYEDISFCFLDAEKDVYLECYETLVPRMVPGGLLVADNIKSHEEILKPMVERALADERVDALVVPIDRGELLCRKLRRGQGVAK